MSIKSRLPRARGTLALDEPVDRAARTDQQARSARFEARTAAAAAASAAVHAHALAATSGARENVSKDAVCAAAVPAKRRSCRLCDWRLTPGVCRNCSGAGAARNCPAAAAPRVEAPVGKAADAAAEATKAAAPGCFAAWLLLMILPFRTMAEYG